MDELRVKLAALVERLRSEIGDPDYSDELDEAHEAACRAKGAIAGEIEELITRPLAPPTLHFDCAFNKDFLLPPLVDGQPIDLTIEQLRELLQERAVLMFKRGDTMYVGLDSSNWHFRQR